ncbi:MAG: hypothetical protein ABI321_21040 [Polyangia bacterium]
MRSRLVALTALIVAFVVSVSSIVELDTPWYLACGQLIWRTKSLPSHDPFSYTTTHAWINHEYLAELVFAGIHHVSGAAGLCVLEGLVVVAVLLLVLKQPHNIGTWLVGALLTFLLREVLSPRAQLLSIVLFALMLRLVLDDDEAKDRRLWWCVPIQVLFTQLHGGNPTGVALLGLAFLSHPTQERFLVGVGVFLATFAGPFGYLVHLPYLEGQSSFDAVREWQPLSNALMAGSLAHWVALLLLCIGAGCAISTRRPLHLLLVLIFSLLAARHARMALEGSIVATAVVARTLRRQTSPWLLALPALVLALLVWKGQRRIGLGFEAGRYPIRAVTWLRANHPPGPMLNSYNYGGYLLWQWPEQRVFVDGRGIIVYDRSMTEALPALYNDLGRYAAMQARWGFRLAVLQRHGRGAQLAEWLPSQPGWSIAYEDAQTRVLTRVLP